MAPESGFSRPKTHPVSCTLLKGFAYVKDFALENLAGSADLAFEVCGFFPNGPVRLLRAGSCKAWRRRSCW